MKDLRIVALVSDDMSDIYFANALTKNIKLAGLIIEQSFYQHNFFTRLKKAIKLLHNPFKFFQKLSYEIQSKHFDSKALKVHQREFRESGIVISPNSGCQVFYTKENQTLNDPSTIQIIKDLSPDLIVVCGTSVLCDEILSIPPRGILNLHGGLSQKYRGTWTTLWAIYNSEPEYIGATVHFVDKGIDTGKIVYQGRPELVPFDNPETAYAKVVKLGIKMMLKAISDIENKTIRCFSPSDTGALYTRSMLNATIIGSAWKKCREGIIADYLNHKKERDYHLTKILKDTLFVS